MTTRRTNARTSTQTANSSPPKNRDFRVLERNTGIVYKLPG